ncbi:hypothetical protein GH5_05825 [Leishmania sp. Ghana 2012 LV757]|uniref:hypothetical protein n=1 Tax=Leishmania sp. Ghana 2012 LV757 TaxID=2803181 RepID=UPI001B50EFC7|nr:hypothetical protein GH5_05825 [Leishmania sp. Ghana 2012 LV757]
MPQPVEKPDHSLAWSSAPKRSPGRSMPRKPSNLKKRSLVHRGNINGRREVPVNTRAMPLRDTPNFDSVSVCGRFEGQSRCSAMTRNGLAWTGEKDGSIVIRLAPSGVEVGRIEPIGGSAVLVMLNVGGCIWAGYADGAIRIFDHATHKVLRESTQHTAAVYAMCAADGFVYTGGADWKVYQWMSADLHYSRIYYGHRNAVRSLTTYMDQASGRGYVVSGSDDGTIKVWEAAAAKTYGTTTQDGGCVATLEKQSRCFLSVLALEDTAELWAGGEDSAIHVCDLNTMTFTNIITAHRAPVVALQKVEETVWSGSKDGAIAITNRFSKAIVYRASQSPASSSVAAGMQRFAMSILPVTRSVVCNVWATAAGGSWQCWNFTLSDSVKPHGNKASVFMRGKKLLRSRTQRSSRAGPRRRRSRRNGAFDTSDHSRSRSVSAPPENRDEELRESVARLRHTVAVLLADPEAVHFGNSSGTYVSGDLTHRNEARNADDEDDGIPLDAVAEWIRNDHRADTQKEVQRLQTALAVEMRKSAELRAELEKMGTSPEAITARGAMEGRSGMSGSPATEKLA